MRRRRRVEIGAEPRKKRKARKIEIPSNAEAERQEIEGLEEYLESVGDDKGALTAKMFRAKHMIVVDGARPIEVADEIGVPAEMVVIWAQTFDWRLERYQHLFGKYMSVQELHEKRVAGMDERHDRLAFSMEALIEDMLEDHANPESRYKIKPKDLSTLANAVKTLQSVRRTADDRVTSKKEMVGEANLTISTDAGVSKIAEMLHGAIGPARGASLSSDGPAPRQIALSDAVDVEFEVTDDKG